MDEEFEWDEAKRLANIAKHGIDFERAKELWRGRFLEIPSPQQGHGEERFLAYGEIEDGMVIATVFTWRDGRRRLISARKARDYERDWYNAAEAG